MVFELFSVFLTVLAAGLFYLSVPSQCLLRRSLAPRKSLLPGLLCLLFAVGVMSLKMQFLTSLMAVGTVLMLGCILLPLILAFVRPQGRLS